MANRFSLAVAKLQAARDIAGEVPCENTADDRLQSAVIYLADAIGELIEVIELDLDAKQSLPLR